MYVKYYHGVSIEKDPRFKDKYKGTSIKYPPNVTEKLSIIHINAEAFGPWIARELKKYVDDDFLPETVVGFLQSEEIDSQELGQYLQVDLKENTADFVSALWDLLTDAETNGIGIPKVIMDETKKEIEEKMKRNILINNKLNADTSSDSSSSSDSYSDESKSEGDIEKLDVQDDKKSNAFVESNCVREPNDNAPIKKENIAVSNNNDNFIHEQNKFKNSNLENYETKRKDYYDDFPDEENETFANDEIFHRGKQPSNSNHHSTKHKTHLKPHHHHHHHHHSSRHRH